MGDANTVHNTTHLSLTLPWNPHYSLSFPALSTFLAHDSLHFSALLPALYDDNDPDPD